MASVTSFRTTDNSQNPPRRATIPASANTLYPGGCMVTRTSAGRGFNPVTADVSGQPCIGVSRATIDNRTGTVNYAPADGTDDSIDLELDYGVFDFDISGTTPIAGDDLFVVDNHTVSTDSLGGTRGFAGVCTEVRNNASGTAQAYVLITPTATRGAAGNIRFDLTGALDVATGAKMAVFANGASTTPGTQFTDSKTAAVRWNNDAAPGAIAFNLPIPPDLDPARDLVLKAIVSKVGATVGDATKLTVGAFLHAPGSLHDADVDFGGDTGAIAAPAAASKTVQAPISVTLAAANLIAAPCGLCLTIKPKAGTLGTDDLVLHEAWLEYTRK